MPGFNIGTNSRLDPTNLAEVNRVHRWRIVSLGGIVSQDSLLFARSITLPTFSVEEEVVIGAASRYKFAKTVNWEDVTVSFYDMLRRANAGFQWPIYDELLEWQNLVYTNENGIGVAHAYKKLSSFVMTDGNGEDIPPIVVLHGSWPKSITHSPLSYEDSDLKRIDIILACDFVTFDYETTLSVFNTVPATPQR